MGTQIDASIPEAYAFLFEKSRYKVCWGGRGKGASWSIARYLIIQALQTGERILCTREFQNSIADSVHRLLVDQIDAMGLSDYFHVTDRTIKCPSTSGVFLFEGIRHNPTKIKSMEGIGICWITEAEKISNESLDILIPTIRKQGSEIIIDFNPDRESDPVYERFVRKTRKNAIVRHLTFRDNPFFPETMREEMEYDKRVDPDKYRWIWEGNTRTFSDALVFKDKYEVVGFETEAVNPERFYFGADWGFSQDPTTLVRSFVIDKTLYIDYEAYGLGVDIERIPALFDLVPESRKWPIRADSARPETINHMVNHGFKVSPAKKGKGSVEDGISYLRSFEKIIIHPRCTHAIDEFGSYSYKRDRTTGEILPVLQDANNHIIDALRYALELKSKKKSGKKLTAAALGF